MPYKHDFKHVYNVVNSFTVFSDHEHHHPDGFFADGVDVAKLIRNSYVFWMVGNGGMERVMADRAAFLDSVKYNSYFRWLEKGMQKVHQTDLPLTAATWADYDTLIATAHRDRDFHWKTLLRHGYERVIVDAYWDPGSDDNHPEIFSSTFRVDKLSYGHHPDAVAVESGPLHDPSLLYPWKHYRFTGSSLDEYVDMLRQAIVERYTSGKIVSLKTAIAYNRDINFYPDSREAALAAWNKAPADITAEELRCFGNYIFHRCFEVAEKHDIPVQIHTGLADLRGSNPLLVEPLLRQYPTVRFVIFHSGYPWSSEAAALSHNFRNAFPSLTWTPLISTSAAVRILDEYIDVAPSINTITWGSDSWMPEESVGAQLAWKHVVATVLCRRLCDGLITAADVGVLAAKLMHGNGRYVYLEHGW